ncbi:type IV secretory system conjugative DNA transfer family protein [Methylibium sp.]|uniref:type IV secretory system conjugative DNA transfer family protein n=1 Tax=Methylibium sp. TaxID=2067992 RepID=UPI003D10B645
MSSVAALPFSAWPTGRKVAAGAFAVIGYAALACAAVYLAGVLFLVLNKANPKQAQFASIVRYWELYSDDAQLRKKLQLAIGVSGIGLLILLPVGLVAAARPRRALHGDARFASPAEIDRAGLTGSDGQPGILIGRHRGRFLSLPGQLSVMLSAPTRSGKGVGVVIPNLLNWPDSVVVLDIKGENYDITAGYRAAHGQAVYAFSPFDEDARSHRWNPLTAVRSSPLHRVGDLLTIGQVFFPNDGGGTSSEAFFNDQARNLFLGLGLVLLETPSLPRTIGEMLRQSSGKGRSLKDHLSGLITQRREEGNPLSDECADALQRLLSNSENTLSSVVATFNAPLTIFADAVVDAATSADDFKLDDVRRRRMSVYVRIPPNRLANARPLLNLFFSQLVSLNTQHLPEQDPTLIVQCLLVNDEFTAMGRVGVITTAAAFLAGYNLRLLTVVQAMSQLDAVYGDKEARTFATNHGLQILYAPREQRDADEYSAMLGHFTERATSRGRSRSFSGHGSSTISRNESEQRRALLLPQEFKELGSERLVVIFENCKPILGEKIRYYREKAFSSRLMPAPAVPRMNMDLHLARVQQRWRYVDDELPAGQTLSLETLAHDHTLLPDSFEGPPDKVADELLTFFDKGAPGIPGIGGSIEPVADEDGVLLTDEDGVFLADSDATVMTLDVAALDADIDAPTGGEPRPPEAQINP